MMTTDRNFKNLFLASRTKKNLFITFLPGPNGPENLQNASDTELIRQYREDFCQLSFAVLFERYSHLVLGICMKYLGHAEEARDAVMDIFEELMQKIHRSDIRNFKAWLYQVVKNHCLQKLRRNHATATDDLSTLLVPEDSPEHPSYDGDLLRISMGLISPEQRRCLELFYLEGYQYKDIEQETGFSLKEIKSHLQNGRRMLRKSMRRSA